MKYLSDDIKHDVKIDENAYVFPGAVVVGDVEIAEDASIWYNAVLRGDIAPIKIGKRSNIQDNATVHVDYDMPAIIGDFVTVGHGAVIHGSTIGNKCLIAMNSVILSGCKIGNNCIIAAGAVVPENTVIPDYSMVAGIPAKIKKTLTDDDIEKVMAGNKDYVRLAKAMIKLHK